MLDYTFTKRLWSECRMFKHNWLVCILSFFYNSYILSIIGKNLVFYIDKPVKQIEIQDLLFNLLPEYTQKNIHDIPQLILWLSSFYFLIIMPVTSPIFHRNKIFSVSGFIILNLFASVIFTLRTISYLVTVIPDPSRKCRLGLYEAPLVNGIFLAFVSHVIP